MLRSKTRGLLRCEIRGMLRSKTRGLLRWEIRGMLRSKEFFGSKGFLGVKEIII